ncbi:MAG: hypothetical protein Q4P15_07330 [Propionibacteriaceae bacterium]|nr:hypothetical protein [Propionibacteriaceae bacterium]
MINKRLGTLTITALSLVGVIALGGCSAPTVEQDPATPPVQSSEAAPESSGSSEPVSPTESPSAAEEMPAGAPELPEGSQWAESSTQGIRFAVPATWSVVDPQKLFTSGSEQDIEAAATEMGMTVAELQQASTQIDIMVMGPAEAQFAPNVNVVPTALKALPTEEMMAAELESVGATPAQGSTQSTDLGEVIVVPYVLELESSTVHGRSILVPVSDGFTSITVSHVTDADAEALTEQLLSTLHGI